MSREFGREMLVIGSLAVFAAPFFGCRAQAADTRADIPSEPPVSTQMASGLTEHRSSLEVFSSATTVNYQGATTNGIGLGASVAYALSDSFGIKGSLTQTFYISGFTPLASSIDVGLVYALTGSLIRRDEQVSLGGQQVLDAQSERPAGLRLEGLSDLAFYNGSAAVVPFFGVGFAADYEFPSKGAFGYVAGARMDFLSSAQSSLAPAQLFVGVSF